MLNLVVQVEPWKRVRQAVLVLCLGLVAAILAPVAYHVPGWCRVLDKTLLHVDRFAGEGEIAMRRVAASALESEKASVYLNQQLPTMVEQFKVASGGLITVTTQVNRFMATSGETLKVSQGTLRAAAGTLDKTSDTLRKLDGRISEVSTASSGALNSIPPTMLSLGNFMDGPLTSAVGEFGSFMRPTALMANDLQQMLHDWRYPAPYSGRFRRLNTAWRVVNALAPVSQPVYNVTNTIRGRP